MEEQFRIIVEQMVKKGVPYNIKKSNEILIDLLSKEEDKIVTNRINVLMDIENHYKDGRVYFKMNPFGTVTGRPSTTDFNISSVPSNKKIYGKEIRKCFEVKKGRTLIGFDASNLELRLLAHFMKDEEYIKTVENGDIHMLNMKKAGLSTREEAKEFIYSMLYGGGIKLLAKKLGVSESRAKEIKDNFLKNLPLLDKLLKQLDGRTSIKTFTKKDIPISDNYKGLNYLLQSNASVIMKTAIINAHHELCMKDLINKCRLVINVYDEAHYEVDDECINEVTHILQDCVKKAGEEFNLRCELKSELKIGKSWADTH